MTTVKLRISELRKRMGINQQELADVLGVSFQSVSKWETGATMPDITLLPIIANYFNVSVDELLGLKPLSHQEYIPRNSDNHDVKSKKLDQLYHNRKYFWNDDYLKFLMDDVWHMDEPINIIDFRCCNGYMGLKLLELLPKGSTYTGIDTEHFIKEAKSNFDHAQIKADFIVSDLYSFHTNKKYDMAICQAGLRHVNKPEGVLGKMVDCVKKNGLIVCVEVNREFEEDGLYVDGMDYDMLCTTFDYHKLWRKELEMEGRDYAVGMRIPFYMQQLGLHDIDVRMNDKVLFADQHFENHVEIVEDFIRINGFDKPLDKAGKEDLIDVFMSRGYERSEVEAYIDMHAKLTSHFTANGNTKSFLKVNGLMIAYGRK